MAPTMEVCVDNFESVIAAVKGGCPRIELCSSLLDGGLTPSVGFLRRVKASYPDLIVFCMIRPRGGDFCYSEDELAISIDDIESLQSNGADGFVFGCLRTDGSVDIDSNRRLISHASQLPCTFHRAFDMVRDFEPSLQAIIDLGFKRILTSGQSPSAMDGLEQIAKLVQLAGDRIIIMAGSGVNENNLQTILKETLVREFHSSASGPRDSIMTYRNPKINMGSSAKNSEFCWKVSIENKVHRMIEISNSV